MSQPIELYFWPTPNGLKISIALEEMALPYLLRPVDLSKGEQFAPAFLAVSPNNRMPAIVDPDGPGGAPISIFESGAILLYLARKSGQFLPHDQRQAIEVEEWLFWQMAGLGPMAGQYSHFKNYAEKLSSESEQLSYSRERYAKEVDRLLGVLDRRLRDRDFIAGEYSIADMATFPWVRSARNMGLPLAAFPSLVAWVERVRARPAVVRGLGVGDDLRKASQTPDGAALKVLFGQTAASVEAAAIAAKQG